MKKETYKSLRTKYSDLRKRIQSISAQDSEKLKMLINKLQVCVSKMKNIEKEVISIT